MVMALPVKLEASGSQSCHQSLETGRTEVLNTVRRTRENDNARAGTAGTARMCGQSWLARLAVSAAGSCCCASAAFETRD